jgi:hypothetical protein
LSPKKTQYRFKTYKSDAAPFFFFIDIFPLTPSDFKTPRSSVLVKKIKDNPIMPLPMRVDRVFNGDSSILVRPDNPISFPIENDITAVVNPIPFIQLGLEKLVFFTEIRANEKFFLSIKPEKAYNWWENTKFLYARLKRLEEDFSAFIRAYLHTIMKSKVNEGDMIGAAREYCTIVNDICNDRMKNNIILTEIKNRQDRVKLYKQKEAKYREKFQRVSRIEYHPELIDIEFYNLIERGFSSDKDERNMLGEILESKILKYIPILFYDDLQECMLLNLKKIDEDPNDLLDFSKLIDSKVILLIDPNRENIENYNWWKDLSEINIKLILESIKDSLVKVE